MFFYIVVSLILLALAAYPFPWLGLDELHPLPEWADIVIGFMVLSTPIAAALFIDGIFLMIKFHGYRREHRQFLRKYNREHLYYGS